MSTSQPLRDLSVATVIGGIAAAVPATLLIMGLAIADALHRHEPGWLILTLPLSIVGGCLAAAGGAAMALVAAPLWAAKSVGQAAWVATLAGVVALVMLSTAVGPAAGAPGLVIVLAPLAAITVFVARTALKRFGSGVQLMA